MMQPIEFFVDGIPKPQPRPRFTRRGNRVYDAGTAKLWKIAIRQAARRHVPRRGAIDHAVRVDLLFYLPRPKAHFRTGKFRGDLRNKSPKWVTVKPDRDNLDKAVLDALTRVGMWTDDSLVVDGRIIKRYAARSPGVQIRISEPEE